MNVAKMMSRMIWGDTQGWIDPMFRMSILSGEEAKEEINNRETKSNHQTHEVEQDDNNMSFCQDCGVSVCWKCKKTVVDGSGTCALHDVEPSMK